jgi:hypothetical protein
MKKRTQVAMSLAAGYLIVKIGIAIYRHPIGAAVALAIMIVLSLCGGASALEAAHGAVSLTAIYAFVFIIAIAYNGQWLTATLGFIAILVGARVAAGLIDQLAPLVASRTLGDYHWLIHRNGWFPSPLALMALIVLAAIKALFWPSQPVNATSPKRRSPPTYDTVRSVADVLARINAGLIEQHFALTANIAEEFMTRLVAEGIYGVRQEDGWHYPAKSQGRRSRWTTTEPKPRKHVEENMAPEDEQGRRVAKLEEQVRAQNASINRLRAAGKTIIAQREEWKSRALNAEATLRRQHVTGNDRFDALRRLVARELHPDHCMEGEIEKVVRAEFFKRLWPEIERISERRRD